MTQLDDVEELPSPSSALLQLARLKADMTQRQLAERAGVPVTMIAGPGEQRASRTATDSRPAGADRTQLAVYLARTSTNSPAAREPSIRGLIGC